MAKRLKPRFGASPVSIKEGTAADRPGNAQSEWDEVAQASWESFPASDPPGWINASSRSDQPLAGPKGS